VSFKPFYIHAHRGPGKITGGGFRGFTVHISPNEADPRSVFVRATICSPKDQFCKKEGRSQVATKIGHPLNKRQLPEYLALLDLAMWNVEHDKRWIEKNYLYVLKYVI
jgi:hypothetical protein